jgi:diaminobutyrate-2-oxoglutarate transaminase
MDIFERLESKVRSYSRAFPTTFDRASGPYLFAVDGRRYIDFFCGAGALNYGHNEPALKRALIDYLAGDGVLHSLDMATAAKARFLERFERIILKPRGLDYRVQFTGPTGANAVEAALKLARKVTGRRQVIAFTSAYHGLSAGALAVTANSAYRDERFLERGDVAFMPYDGYLGSTVDSAAYLRQVLEDEASGIGRPAAIIVETIQAEGGINLASAEWLRSIQAICRDTGALLIVDDIQTGCGRTGTFFSFEAAGLQPDLVVLSKSISGSGLPMSLLLIKPECDQWSPGEHSGTFRGNNAAFVTAAEALSFWETPRFAAEVAQLNQQLAGRLALMQQRLPDAGLTFRGRGLIWGVETRQAAAHQDIARECFNRGLIVETCGGKRRVLKLLPPLNITSEVMTEGLDILEAAIGAVLGATTNESASEPALAAPGALT